MDRYCKYCLNHAVDNHLTSENDLSYISVGGNK